MKHPAIPPFHLCVALALGTSLFAACGLDESGTVPATEATSSSISSSSSGETASSSGGGSGTGGTIFSGSSSSSGGGTGGTGGSPGVSSSSSSASSSSGGGSGQCPVCSKGTLPNCAAVPVGTDDCATPGELCDAKGACACGVSAPVTGTCPTSGGWEPGATPGVCLRKCDTNNECKNTTLDCPAGFDCVVECSGSTGCGGAQIKCPAGQSCNVSCSASNACNGSHVFCSADGPCSVDCGNFGGACNPMTITCGDNSCNATCAGGSKPTLGQAPTTMSCNPKGC